MRKEPKIKAIKSKKTKKPTEILRHRDLNS